MSQVFKNEDMVRRLTKEFSTARRVDIIVGYATDFGIDFIAPFLDSVEKTRIIVGMNDSKDIVTLLAGVASGLIKRSGRPSRVISLLQSGKLEIRVPVDGKLHAKAFIFTRHDGSGEVLVGSNNLTKAGLFTNVEITMSAQGFEAAATAQKAYVDAMHIFETEWEKASLGQDLRDSVIEEQKELGSMVVELTQYELFIRVLQDIYKGSLSLGDYENAPSNFKVLQYQEDAVVQLNALLDRHNGCFLADVVGLGKTYVSALSMLRLPVTARVLVTCPAGVRGVWLSVLKDFGVQNVEVLSHAMLSSLVEKRGKHYTALKRFSHIYVDEAHRFRNVETRGYKQLKALCEANVKVVLVTATPLNNNPSELRGLLGLFQNLHGRSSIIEGQSLSRYLLQFTKTINKARASNNKERILREVTSCGLLIRKELLNKITIRRTRKDIMKYYSADMVANGWEFPVVQAPVSVRYDLLKMQEKILDITQEMLGKLKFARYRLHDYVEEGVFEDSHKYLSNIIKLSLMKRMDSSIHSFVLSIGTMVRKYEQTVKDFHAGFVRKDISGVDFDDVDVIGKIPITRLKNADLFLKHISDDLESLKEFKDTWGAFRDIKLEEFLRTLGGMDLASGKLLVFSQYKTTVEYLEKELKARGFRVLGFDASKGYLRDVVSSNFDANIATADDYDILVTTDALSEGVNLHTANKVVNYDIPWNPVVVIQRVGRVNRVGTKFDKIHIYNFFPTVGADKVIKSEKNILSKLRVAFHFFGDDVDVLSSDGALDDIETIESQIHDIVKAMNEELNETGDIDSYYINLLRGLRLKNRSHYTWLESLTGDIIASRNLDFSMQGSLFYVSNNGNPAFYLVAGERGTPVGVEDALQLLSCSPSSVSTESVSVQCYVKAKTVLLDEHYSVKDSLFIGVQCGFDTGGGVIEYLKTQYAAISLDSEKQELRGLIKDIRAGKYDGYKTLEADVLGLVKDKESFASIKRLFDEYECIVTKSCVEAPSLICALV